MAAKDLYALLGIQRGAKPDEIKKAYRRLARKHHPDVNPGDKSAEERFKDISQAHDILSDPDKRKIYDEFGMEGLQSGFDPQRARAYDEWAERRQSSAGPQGTSGGFGRYERFEDIFGDLFGGAAHTGPQAGADIEAPIEIDLLDAIRGLSREISIDRPVECTVCHGTGNDPASETVCPECHGSGHVQVGQGPVAFKRACPRCGGAGRIATKRCQACAGQGQTSHRERLQVHIPAGVDSGSRVRVAGKGAAGHAGGAAGDLFLVIRVRANPLLERRGNDLYLDVPISVGEAVLGGSITVPTPRGELRVKVPPGSQSGKLLRIPKRGVPAPKGGEAGNLYMRLMIQVPETGTDQMREAIRMVDAAYGRDLRSGLRF